MVTKRHLNLTEEAIIYVDGAYPIPKNWRFVRLTVGLSADGRIVFAKTCLIDCNRLVPNYKSSIQDNVLVEISGCLFGMLAAIEKGILSFDMITDSDGAQQHLKRETNIYNRFSLLFLSISAKKLWIDHNSPPGEVAWIGTKKNRADVLSRWVFSNVGEQAFLNLIRSDMANFEAATKAVYANQVITVAKGADFDFHLKTVIATIMPMI